jgi:hypothetical protein
MIEWTAAIEALRRALAATFDEFPPAGTAAGVRIERAFCVHAGENMDVALTVAHVEKHPAPMAISFGGAAAQPEPERWQTLLEALETTLTKCFTTLSPDEAVKTLQIGQAFESLVAQTIDEVKRHHGRAIGSVDRAWGAAERLAVRLLHQIRAATGQAEQATVFYWSGNLHWLRRLQRERRSDPRNPDDLDRTLLQAIIDLRFNIWFEAILAAKTSLRREELCRRLTARLEDLQREREIEDPIPCGTLTRRLPCLLHNSHASRFIDRLMVDGRARSTGVPLAVGLWLGEMAVDLLVDFIDQASDPALKAECVEALRRVGGCKATRALCGLEDPAMVPRALSALESLASTPVIKCVLAEESGISESAQGAIERLAGTTPILNLDGAPPSDAGDEDCIRFVLDHIDSLQEKGVISGRRADEVREAIYLYAELSDCPLV